MRIVCASLCYRFYTSDGWTRQDVANLLVDKDIHKVLPRWFDIDTDESVPVTKDFLLEDNREYLDCDYFACYNHSHEFDNNKLMAHEFDNPFSRTDYMF